MKNKYSISRRAMLGSLARAGLAASLLKNSQQNAAAQEPSAPVEIETEKIEAENKGLNARQRDSISIRTISARKGVNHASSFKPSSKDADALRIEHYSKALNREGKKGGDPLLPQSGAFRILHEALDHAYERSFTREGVPNPTVSDSDALDALAKHIGEEGQENFRLTNPLGGLSFDLEGTDPASSRMPWCPAFNSAQTAAEMAELYWMALLRDERTSVLDEDQASSPSALVDQAIADLNNYSWYKDPAGPGQLDRKSFLRARLSGGVPGFEGVNVGPYLSQFLLRGTKDPGSPVNSGPEEGIVGFGSLRLAQRQRTVMRGKDFLVDPRIDAPTAGGVEDWYKVHNGSRHNIGRNSFEPLDILYFLRTFRDGANYVHFDEIYQEYLITASILLSGIPRSGDTKMKEEKSKSAALTQQASYEQVTSESGFPGTSLLNAGNPYRHSPAQVGFATFGVTHLLTLLAEVSTRAHKAGWYHKWLMRRLRPEEFGARIQSQLQDPTLRYDIHGDLLHPGGGPELSEILKRIHQYNDTVKKDGAGNPVAVDSYLLPVAFPEGCPTHPAYPSGHATVAGAAVTILKALFNETYKITNFEDTEANVTNPPVFITGTKDTGTTVKEFGTALTEYSQAGLQLRVGGELNKLASNIVYFRGIAGVHWTSDSVEGLLLGERVAIELLVEQTVVSEDGAHRTPFYRERLKQGPPVKPGAKPASRSPFFRFTTFKGVAIDIVDGRIHYVEKNSADDQEAWVRTDKTCDFEEFAKEHYHQD